LQENPGDARLLFTLRANSEPVARDTTDDDLQSQRLNRALANYRFGKPRPPRRKPTKPWLSRAHEAMGRILAFLERKRQSDERIRSRDQLGEVTGGAYRDAMEGSGTGRTPECPIISHLICQSS